MSEKGKEWAEKHHISAIVDMPGSNILFAKRLAEEAFDAGRESLSQEFMRLIETEGSAGNVIVKFSDLKGDVK